MTSIVGDVAIIGGLLLALGIIWAFGWELVELFFPALRETGPLEAAASLICGVILCGFVVMVPAKLAPSEGAFRLVIQWLVPVFVILVGAILLRRRARQAGGRIRPSLGPVSQLRPWYSVLALVVVTAIVLLHRPISPPTIELSGAKESNSIRIEIAFSNLNASPYVLTATAASLKDPIVYTFVAPPSGTMAFSFPTTPDLAISLATPQGQVLRTLFLQ